MDLTLLEKQIVRANGLYLLGISEISDDAYDALIDQLPQDHPLRNFLGPRGVQETYKHEPRMRSLGKVKDVPSAVKWLSKLLDDPYILVFPKLDGVACRLVYFNGKFVGAYTRGDGEYGENISSKVIGLPSVCVKISNAPTTLCVDGELVLSKENFSNFRKDDQTSARSAVVGYLSRDDVGAAKHAGVEFLAYAVHGEMSERSTWRRLQILRQSGIQSATVYHQSKASQIFEGGLETALESAKVTTYDTDGIVLRIDDVSQFHEMGYTAHHPKGALALKHANTSLTSTVTGVHWQVGRTGVLTPVLSVVPVEIEGALISKATLHNYAAFRMFRPKPNATVQLRRSGGVIPFVVSVDADSSDALEFDIPSECPSCGLSVHVNDNKVDLICDRAEQDPTQCPQAAIEGILHFAKVIGIDGVGPSVAERLVECGGIRGSDLYHAWKKEMLESMFTPGLAKNLRAEISAKLELPLATILEAVGIDMLGKVNAKLLADKLAHIEKQEILQQLDCFAFSTCFGPTVSVRIESSYRRRRPILEHFLKYVTIRNAPVGGYFSGKSFVFTGELSISRNSAEDYVTKLGGTVLSSVSKKTDYLVCANLEDNSTKTQKALKLQASDHPIQILNERQFLDLLTQANSV